MQTGHPMGTPLEPLQPVAGANLRRPSSPKVFGILSIIFGSLVGLYSLAMMAGGSMWGSMQSWSRSFDGGADPFRDAFEAMSRLYLIQGLVFAAMSFWLLAIGIGQVKYRRWAQRMSVRWSVIALVVLVGVAILQFVLIPQLFGSLRFGEDALSPGAGFERGMATMTAVFTIVFYAPYPILLLVFFRKPVVVGAMAS
jgi:hypothetical protein